MRIHAAYPVFASVARPVAFGSQNAARPIPDVLLKNKKADFITPSHVQYHHQWLWDAAFHAIILSRFDMDMAKKEITSLLSVQWPNGFVPHTRFNPAITAEYRPNANDWNTGHGTSGITQPPIIATAVKEMMKQGVDKAFLAQVYPQVLKFHEWLKADRDNAGLLAIVHPWESGTDNSPLWDAQREKLLKDRYEQVNVPQRPDAKKVNADERPKDDDYKVYWGLIGDFQKLGWDQAKIGQASPFKVADPLFNSLWVRANEDLADVAEKLGSWQDARKLRGWASETREAMKKQLWNDQDALFYAKDLKTGQSIPIKTIHSLMPLYAGVPTWAMARRMIEQHYQNPREFYGKAGVPSTAFDEPAYDPKRYWRGPVWINTQWMLVQGLKNYYYFRLANELADKTKQLVAQSGYREYYHPDTGAGLGAPDFSWSALADIL